MKKIILASTSPRRKELLEQLGLTFEIIGSRYEEDMQAMEHPYELVKFLALKKGEDVANHCQNAIIISADTFIVSGNTFIGKPKGPADAKQTLQQLSGNKHEIVTGYALIDTDTRQTINDFCRSTITFRDLSEDEIDDYIATGEPLDKAGAYGIQERGAVLIEKIEGDYFSIVGLPLAKIFQGLKKFGINVLKQ